MKRIRLTIPIEPVPKGRPRTALMNGQVRTYTPQRTLDFEDTLRAFAIKHKDKMFEAHVPIRVSITFYRTKPKWCPKGTKKSAWRTQTLPSRKPDLDNYIKTLDSLNGILFSDDAQITTLLAKKRWAIDGNSRIEIDMMEELES